MAGRRSDSSDPRAARVHAQLEQAAYDLLEERPATTISVTDIVQRAGVSRAVFYQHFTDRDDAIAAAILGLIDAVLAGSDLPVGDMSARAPLQVIEDVATLVAERHRIYGHLFPGAAAERARWRLRDGLRTPCRALVADGTGDDLDVETLTSALVGAVIELLLEWVGDPASARPPAAIRAAVSALASRLAPSSGVS